MPGLIVAARRYGNAVVVDVAGELDLATAPQLREELSRALHARPGTLIVDLTRLRFLDSCGINVLLQTHRDAGEHVRFRVVARDRVVLHSLQLCGVEEYLALYATRVEALAAD